MQLTSAEITSINLNHNWHPCSQMKDFATFPPMIVDKAKGPYLYLQTGQTVIDAISSWWCKSLGHGHPHIQAALQQQLDRFEHVMFGNTTYDHITRLSQKLAQLKPNLTRVSYACDGSSAVEIAMKKSLHAQQILGHSQRTQFMALENSYHGDTTLAMSVTDLGRFSKPYESIIHPYPKLTGIPYVLSKADPLWHDCSAIWPNIEKQLEQYRATLSAIIVEPIVQGAAGMQIYSQDFLKRLRAWTTANNIHLIADEIMTGFYRTGPRLACDYADITPDFLCLGKGLTSGFLPLSAVLTSQAIYDLFYDDYEQGKTFMHSHTHTGNALALNAALATLEAMEQEQIAVKVPQLEIKMGQLMQEVADETKLLTNVRAIGGIAAAELINPNNIPRLGYRVGMAAAQKGVLLRPLGNTIYWLLPLNTTDEILSDLKSKTQASILQRF